MAAHLQEFSALPRESPTVTSKRLSSSPLPQPTSPVSESPPQPRRLRRILPPIVVLAAVALIGWRYEHTATESTAELVLQGNIDVRQVNLSFKVAGRIAALRADEGDAVKAGQTLAVLDEVYFKDDLQLAQAQRDQAAANYERQKNGSRPEEIDQARAKEVEATATVKRAEEDYRRAERLRTSTAISPQEYEERHAAFLEAQARLKSAEATRKLAEIGPRAEDIAAARAQLAAAEAQVVAAERRLVDATLLAPNDGVILTRARESGAVVNAGETVFTLTLASPVWVRTYVDEPDLGTVEPGMVVAVGTDAGRSYTGHVGFVSPTAEFTPKSVETRELRTDLVYRLRVVVDDPDGGLRQGMPVTIAVKLPGRRLRTMKERLIEALWLDRLGLVSGGKP